MAVAAADPADPGERMRSGPAGVDAGQRADVEVEQGQGFLSDHYDPVHKKVRLSPHNYSEPSVAAISVAAHECGHAVQHATAYAWLNMRTAMVPVLNFSNVLMNIVLFAAIFGAFAVPGMGNTILLIYIISQGLITLFSLITLPVEVDASNRAIAWLGTKKH